MRHLFPLFLVLSLACTHTSAAVWANNWTDVLDLHNVPTQQLDVFLSIFSDLGAWHGWALPDSSNTYAGGFIGPFIHGLNMGFLGKCVAQLYLISDGSALSYTNITTTYYPGMLQQTFVAWDEGQKSGSSATYNVTLQLVFASHRTSLVTVCVKSSSSSNPLTVRFTGDAGFFENSTMALSGNNGGLNVTTNKNNAFAMIQFQPNMTWTTALNANNTYVTESPLSNNDITFTFTQSVLFNEDEWEQEQKYILPSIFEDTKPYFGKASLVWSNYLSSLLRDTQTYQVQWLLVKSVLTLITNWRSPLTTLLYNALLPSYSWYKGFWGWDSWKHSAALAHFSPDLAMDHILALYAVQNQTGAPGIDGMIPDVFFTFDEATNWNNSKPPLSAWAVNEIYEYNHDVGFIEAVYPYMVQFHEWWYINRDHNQNGLCEFGCIDGGLETAKWESGMDNAARFDGALMVKNGQDAYSMNRDNVDLNSFLYAEKLFLANIANALNFTADAERFQSEAAALLVQIQNTFFNSQSGFFQDAYFNGTFVNALGCEGYAALFAGAATPAQAAIVANTLFDPSTFLSQVPFPTLSLNNPAFDPNGYWRGPVWVDQVYFVINGLRKYNLTAQAEKATQLFLSSAPNLQAGNQIPFSETYNPLNGTSTGIPHFGWTAACMILMLAP